MIGYKDPLFTELMRLYLTIHRFTDALNLEKVMQGSV